MNIFVRLIIPILLLLLGLGGAASMALSAKKEEKVDVPPPLLAVEVLLVTRTEQQVFIKSTGVVRSAQSVNIVPQVAGKVSSVADQMQPGKRFSKGDRLIQIERNDYLLTLEQEKSRVRRAELEYQIEEKRQESAEKEWALLGNEGEATELASRKPQLEVARLNLEAAEAAMERAKITLGRTTIRAPFNGIVQKEQVDVGQVVGAGSPLLTLIGTDEYWIRIAVPASQLTHIDIPDVSAEEGSLVAINTSMSSTSEPQEREGRVLRLEAELDPQSRTAHLLVGIPNPLQGELIMLGSYVDVQIKGKTVLSAARIPASALNNGTHVFVADAENRLARKDVKVGWADGTDVVIVEGLEDGDKIITTALSLPIYGAALNIISSKNEGE
jgi:RND family efflux transporter MFP subunit